jgi:hypothetical protein
LEKDTDHEIHKHDLVLETFQPGWERRSIASITNQIGHAHEGNTPDHYHQVRLPGQR